MGSHHRNATRVQFSSVHNSIGVLLKQTAKHIICNSVKSAIHKFHTVKEKLVTDNSGYHKLNLGQSMKYYGLCNITSTEHKSHGKQRQFDKVLECSFHKKPI